MDTKVILLIVGLVVGGLIGWVTAPPTDVIKVGPLSVEVTQGNGDASTVTATGNDGKVQVQVGNQGPLSDRNGRTLILAIVGGIIGFGAGYFMERRKT